MEEVPGLPCNAVAHLRCWKCQASVVRVALTTRLALSPTCRHGSALDVMYSAGHLTVSCRRCHAVSATVDVAPYGPV
jgi:hypothetical protein